ncbi:hypothetical protein ACX12E_30675 [Paenibacillus vandeheii]
MNKISKIKVEITNDEQIFGSGVYTVSLHITNTTTVPIHQLEVEPNHIIGHQIYISSELTEASDISDLEERKNKIIKEMEKQVESAYERNKYKTLTATELLVYSLSLIIDIYANLFRGSYQQNAENIR